MRVCGLRGQGRGYRGEGGGVGYTGSCVANSVEGTCVCVCDVNS